MCVAFMIGTIEGLKTFGMNDGMIGCVIGCVNDFAVVDDRWLI